MIRRSDFACVLITLAGLSQASAQSTQEWTATLDGYQPGSAQWTLPGPLAADAQGRVLAAAYVREDQPSYPPVTLTSAELTVLHDASGQVLWSKRLATSQNTRTSLLHRRVAFLCSGPTPRSMD